ncbi:unnamed protein product [Linum trigynum]|uniref:Secreted protein n=1 Tax=Linum trigynum TaxID=586398 RepID=A0AAV2FFH6_9ROSI
MLNFICFIVTSSSFAVVAVDIVLSLMLKLTLTLQPPTHLAPRSPLRPLVSPPPKVEFPSSPRQRLAPLAADSLDSAAIGEVEWQSNVAVAATAACGDAWDWGFRRRGLP